MDRLLAEPEAAVRRTLLRLAVHLGPAGVPEMTERLSHPKWFFVRNFCLLLGDIGDRRALASLMTAASHNDLRVKREALQAIGKLGAQEAVPSLGKTLLEESFFSSAKEDPVRIDAANALYKIGDAEEFARIAEHPVIGANILRKIDCGSDLPVIVCFEHHVRHDRSGYPKVTFREPQHPVSRMTQIADVYDALRTNRPYRKGMGMETALSIMERGKGTEFDPALYDNFLRTLLAG